ncbi:MAG TPA: PilZ domain-containing protein, partial [Anaeromyxobacteraceae bacterium]|nr:PilZ domain-containing protein [Anaeromyxobacteraceae bacterium]
GPDAELASALHAHAQGAGWHLYVAPGPADLDALLRAVGPLVLALVLPASPDASWGSALTAAQAAARAGVRVVMVAPAREVVEPLAAVAGAERALSRAELLARPGTLTDATPGRPAPQRPPEPPRPRVPAIAPPPPPAPAPLRTPPPAVAPHPPTVVPPTVAPPSFPSPALAGPDEPPPRPPARPALDLMSLIDEELVEDRRPAPPPNARVEVAVSLVSEHNFYVGTTRRIDSGGVFVATAMPPPVGTRIQVRLGLADGRKIDLDGEVAFLRAKSATTGRQPAGCGVRLIGMPGWAIDAVERFFQARQPIVFAPT